MILIIKHIEVEGPGTIAKFFENKGEKIKILELAKESSFPRLNECKAIISLGDQ